MSEITQNPKSSFSKDPLEFKYMMLSRLLQDVKYFLGYGNKQPKSLYFNDVDEHINEIKALYNELPNYFNGLVNEAKLAMKTATHVNDDTKLVSYPSLSDYPESFIQDVSDYFNEKTADISGELNLLLNKYLSSNERKDFFVEAIKDIKNSEDILILSDLVDYAKIGTNILDMSEAKKVVSEERNKYDFAQNIGKELVSKFNEIIDHIEIGADCLEGRSYDLLSSQENKIDILNDAYKNFQEEIQYIKDNLNNLKQPQLNNAISYILDNTILNTTSRDIMEDLFNNSFDNNVVNVFNKKLLDLNNQKLINHLTNTQKNMGFLTVNNFNTEASKKISEMVGVGMNIKDPIIKSFQNIAVGETNTLSFRFDSKSSKEEREEFMQKLISDLSKEGVVCKKINYSEVETPVQEKTRHKDELGFDI